jgi:hypothetical protein
MEVPLDPDYCEVPDEECTASGRSIVANALSVNYEPALPMFFISVDSEAKW